MKQIEQNNIIIKQHPKLVYEFRKGIKVKYSLTDGIEYNFHGDPYEGYRKKIESEIDKHINSCNLYEKEFKIRNAHFIAWIEFYYELLKR